MGGGPKISGKAWLNGLQQCTFYLPKPTPKTTKHYLVPLSVSDEGEREGREEGKGGEEGKGAARGIEAGIREWKSEGKEDRTTWEEKREGLREDSEQRPNDLSPPVSSTREGDALDERSNSGEKSLGEGSVDEGSMVSMTSTASHHTEEHDRLKNCT